VKKILERRIEELNGIRAQLHNKVVTYGGCEIKEIAEEYKAL